LVWIRPVLYRALYLNGHSEMTKEDDGEDLLSFDDGEVDDEMLGAAKEALGAAKRRVKVGPLDDLDDIFTELGRVYRATRRGDIPSVVGQRLSAILSRAAAVKKATDVEQKLDEVLQLLAAAKAKRA
jgi:hypothetical protein